MILLCQHDIMSFVTVIVLHCCVPMSPLYHDTMIVLCGGDMQMFLATFAHHYCLVTPDQICDLPQASCKPVLACSMVGLSANKPSPLPGFLVKRVYDTDTQEDESQNLKKGGGAPCEPTAMQI